MATLPYIFICFYQYPKYSSAIYVSFLYIKIHFHMPSPITMKKKKKVHRHDAPQRNSFFCFFIRILLFWSTATHSTAKEYNCKPIKVHILYLKFNDFILSISINEWKTNVRCKTVSINIIDTVLINLIDFWILTFWIPINSESKFTYICIHIHI